MYSVATVMNRARRATKDVPVVGASGAEKARPASMFRAGVPRTLHAPPVPRRTLTLVEVAVPGKKSSLTRHTSL